VQEKAVAVARVVVAIAAVAVDVAKVTVEDGRARREVLLEAEGPTHQVGANNSTKIYRESITRLDWQRFSRLCLLGPHGTLKTFVRSAFFAVNESVSIRVHPWLNNLPCAFGCGTV